MAWRCWRAMACRRGLLLSLFSLGFLYVLCVTLVYTPSSIEHVESRWQLTDNRQQQPAQFELQYLVDVGGRQNEMDTSPVDHNRGISMQRRVSTDEKQTRIDDGSQRRLFSSDEDAKAKMPSAGIDSQNRSSHENFSKDHVVEIPRVVHQTWEDLVVPGQNADWIASWKKNHPSWDYWFWTEQGASLMIQKHFPQYSGMYMDYPYTINRADVRRYFIMYKYGGVYADLDVESLRPLDELLKSYKCIIAQEPEEHQVLLYQKRHPNYIMPAFIACRPHHPFFKLVLEMLPQYASRARDLPWNDNIFQSTGPMFLAEVLVRYLKEMNRTTEEYVHLAPSNLFMPTYDSMNDLAFRFQCSNGTSLTLAEKAVCDRLTARNFANVPSADSFTTHHWIHSWSNTFLAQGHISVKDILKGINFTIAETE